MKSRFSPPELARRWAEYYGGYDVGKPPVPVPPVSAAFKEQTRDGLNRPAVRQWC